MFCNNCGKEISDKTAVCPHCGASTGKVSVGQLDGPVGGLGVLCFLIPVVGLILYLVWKDEKPVKSKGAGIATICGFILAPIVIIIIGVAVAVGIQMFDTQAMQLNRQAIVDDLQCLGSSVIQYYRTPSNQGGSGHIITNGTEADIIEYMGWASNPETTDTGTFTLYITGTNVVEIVGVGTETGADGISGVSATLTITCTAKDPKQITITN